MDGRKWSFHARKPGIVKNWPDLNVATHDPIAYRMLRTVKVRPMAHPTIGEIMMRDRNGHTRRQVWSAPYLPPPGELSLTRFRTLLSVFAPLFVVVACGDDAPASVPFAGESPVVIEVVIGVGEVSWDMDAAVQAFADISRPVRIIAKKDDGTVVADLAAPNFQALQDSVRQRTAGVNPKSMRPAQYSDAELSAVDLMAKYDKLKARVRAAEESGRAETQR